jgi:hypothetical protein
VSYNKFSHFRQNQTIKTAGAESNNQNPTNTTIPSHWFSESKQSKSRENPGKWTTLVAPARHPTTPHVYSYTPASLKGLSGNVPTFETAFASVYHCAIPKLCKGMCHRYGVWHESPRPQIHRFRPHAPAPLPGVCFTQHRSTPIAHFERSCSPAGWICGKRASGHRGGAWSERLAPTCRTERARCGQTVAGHPAVRRRRPWVSGRSVGAVSVRACVRPRPSQNGPR